MIDGEILGIVSLLSGFLGTAFFIKAKVEESAKRFAAHEIQDSERHSDVTDRLARIETKLDMLTGQKP